MQSLQIETYGQPMTSKRNNRFTATVLPTLPWELEGAPPVQAQLVRPVEARPLTAPPAHAVPWMPQYQMLPVVVPQLPAVATLPAQLRGAAPPGTALPMPFTVAPLAVAQQPPMQLPAQPLVAIYARPIDNVWRNRCGSHG